MLIRFIYPGRINRLLTIVIVLFRVLVITVPAHAQDETRSNVLPPVYNSLTTDTARMRFLVKAINDSLDEDRLTHVYDWSRAGLALAEKNNIDTMKGIFNFFIGKAFTYKLLKPDSAVVYYKKALPYFPRFRKYNIFSIREIMERYAEAGNKDSSFVYLDTLKAFIDTMPESSPKRISLSQNIATNYQWFGMFKTAIYYYQVAVNGSRKNKDFPALGMALANMGELYDESEDDVKAIQYAKEALGYLSVSNMPYMQTATNIATYYSNLQQFDSAIVYLEKAKAVATRIADEPQLRIIQVALADIYRGQGKFVLAKPLLEQSVSTLLKSEDKWTLIKAYLSLAGLDTSLHDYKSAKDHLLRALMIAKETQQEVLVVLALQGLAVVNAKLGNYQGAYEYQQQYLLRKDSMTSANTKASAADLEIGYQTIQKEEQIKLLKQENDIKNLQLQNSRRSIIFYIVAFIMALAILAVIFYQRNLRNKVQAQRIKAELETKVLRLQMNPHFIFNSLNSIENFMMRNEKRLASDYLNKFARLIRMILDSSRTEVVPIAKDMEALQLYVDLEQLRFDNKFNFKVHIDGELAGGDYRVPSLLIQPYVENAIIHGLAHSEENNLSLTVTASLEDDKVKYMIQDNGIGRSKAMEYNRQNKPRHQSIGLKITEERISLFNNEDAPDSVQITDLYDENKKPGGTKVEIKIKAAS